MPGKVRRIVTGVNAAGRSCILSDTRLPTADAAPGELVRAEPRAFRRRSAQNPVSGVQPKKIEIKLGVRFVTGFFVNGTFGCNSFIKRASIWLLDRDEDRVADLALGVAGRRAALAVPRRHARAPHRGAVPERVRLGARVSGRDPHPVQRQGRGADHPRAAGHPQARPRRTSSPLVAMLPK